MSCTKIPIKDMAESLLANNLAEKNPEVRLTKQYMDYLNLLIALHEALDRDKGTVPASADKYYCKEHYQKQVVPPGQSQNPQLKTRKS